jgi:hypothetical protein
VWLNRGGAGWPHPGRPDIEIGSLAELEPALDAWRPRTASPEIRT